jgi:dsRNA-specific ribonuclease
VLHPIQGQGSFEKVLIESVDYGLLILGESARRSIYFHLDQDYSLQKEKIPENPEAFADALESIFGAGSLVIEISILKNLTSKLGLKYEEKKDFSFVDSVNRVRKLWLNKNETQAHLSCAT